MPIIRESGTTLEGKGRIESAAHERGERREGVTQIRRGRNVRG